MSTVCRGTGRGASRRRGVTLLELMVVVAILAVMAAVAIPTYSTYIRRSKTAEAYSNLQNLFKLASTYYRLNFSTGTTVGFCTVESTNTGWQPTEVQLQRDYDSDASFRALKFSIADPTYYVYEIESAGGQCGNIPSTSAMYTFRARGDLDGDSTYSTFEMSVGSDPNNDLVRSAGFFIAEETE